MNIIEATRKALSEGVGITCENFLRVNRYILPTNTHMCYLIMTIGYTVASDERPAPRWNPKASDILAEDWELYRE